MMTNKIQLEKEAKRLCEENSSHPFLFELPPEKGRAAVNSAQDAEVHKYPVKIKNREMYMDNLGTINVRYFWPEDCDGDLPVLLYMHGGGWVFGNAHTHDKLVRELAARTGAVVVFPEYSLSPEVKYPTAINQCYEVLKWVAAGNEKGLNPEKIIAGGDSAGGNMAAVLSIMSKQKGGPKLDGQLLFYPVTDSDFETDSYNEFAEGYYLSKEGMKWFWDQYITDPAERKQMYASPLRAELEDLKELPEALIITAEADVLRDEGEAYARKLLCADVPVTSARVMNTVHDFCMLNMLDGTRACRAAMNLAVHWVVQRFDN